MSRGVFLTASAALLVLAVVLWQRPGAAVVLALVLLAPYWLGPILVRLTNRMLVPQWTETTEQAFGPLPNPAARYFALTGAELRELGYEPLAFVFQRDLTPGYTTWAVSYGNPQSLDRALLFVLSGGAAATVTPPPPALSFSTRCADGRAVETTTSSHLNVLPHPPGIDVLQIPEIADVRSLHRLHERRLHSLGDAPRLYPAPGEAAPFLALGVADTYALQVSTGYLWFDGGLYRPTWKGALLMTWKLLPPWSWRLKSERARRNAALLRELA